MTIELFVFSLSLLSSISVKKSPVFDFVRLSSPALYACVHVCVSTQFYAQSVTISWRNKVFHSNRSELYRLFTRGVPYRPIYSSASEIFASRIKFDIVIFQEGGIMMTAALNRHCCCNDF